MRSRLVLLSCQTITLGLMMAFLTVPASALFMNRYGATGLPYAYLAVAAAGVVVSTAIRHAQARLSVAAVAVSVLTVYLVLVTSGWLILRSGDGLWVTFPLLVLFPLSIPIGFLIVGAQAGRLLDVRQLKAHFPRVVAGFSVGFGLGSLVSAWLVPLFGSPVQLLGLSVVATVVMILLVATTARQHSHALRTRPASGPSAPARMDSGTAPRRLGLLRNPLVLAIFGYQLLSASIAQLIDYTVFDRAAAHYPDAVALARFFSLFGVVINGVTIVFVVIVAGRLLTRFGVGFGLAADPAGVLLCVIAATVIGLVGGVAGSAFLVVICVARVGDIALTDGMTRTGINAAYQALPADLRLRAQTMIEGAGVPLALGFVGVLLLVVHALSLDVLAVSAVTLVLSVLWFVLARRTFREYGQKLRAEVTGRPWDPQPISINDPASRAAVDALLESADAVDRQVGLRALAESRDPGLQARVRALLDDPNPAWQALGLDFAAPGGMVPAVMGRALDVDWATELRVAAIRAGAGLDTWAFRDDLVHLFDDPDPMVRLAAAGGQVDAGGAAGERALAIWREGVHSDNLHLAGQALAAAAASPSIRCVPDLLELAALDSPPVELTEAMSAHGDLLLPALIELLAGGTGPSRQLDRLMRAAADGRTSQALDVLRSCLISRRRAVGEMAARVLTAADRTVDPDFLGPALDAAARHAARALEALAVLDDRAALQPLRSALYDEITDLATHVTRLIGLAHGRRTGRAVAALGPESGADRGLALEMLEVTMGADLARVAIPLIDPTLDMAARRKALSRFAPRRGADPGQWIAEIAVDDDQHWQETWLQVCALYAAPEILGGAAARFAQRWVDDVDPIMAETAQWVVRVGSPDSAGGGIS